MLRYLPALDVQHLTAYNAGTPAHSIGYRYDVILWVESKRFRTQQQFGRVVDLWSGAQGLDDIAEAPAVARDSAGPLSA